MFYGPEALVMRISFLRHVGSASSPRTNIDVDLVVDFDGDIDVARATPSP
jgi:hypothetical protein